LLGVLSVAGFAMMLLSLLDAVGKHFWLWGGIIAFPSSIAMHVLNLRNTLKFKKWLNERLELESAQLLPDAPSGGNTSG